MRMFLYSQTYGNGHAIAIYGKTVEAIGAPYIEGNLPHMNTVFVVDNRGCNKT